MMLLSCLLVFSVTEYTFAQSIRPQQKDIYVTEKKSVMLSCKYDVSVNSLHWYRQYPGSKPEFVLLVMESSTKHVTYADPRIPGMDGKMSMNDKQVDLEISSAEVTDSALYYCALQPTVTGNTSSLYKNLYEMKKKKKNYCFSVLLL
uniref:T-cell receptor alpha/delta variable 10.0.3 n=1 Tax=Cyprinus carpio TaxID=7962 RepID=A0A8C1ZNQ6_CYPCA